MPGVVEKVSASPSAAAAQLVVACARANLDASALKEVSQRVAAGGLDWKVVLQSAAGNGVQSLVYRALEQACPELLPEAFRRQMREIVHENAARSMILMRQLLRLLSTMHAQGIRAMPYKGPLLAQLAYGDLSLRKAGDLDILVPEADVARARAVLEAAGYKISVQMNAEEESQHQASPHEYDYVYVREEGNVIVELHWRVAGRILSFTPDPVDLWNRAEPLNVGGTTIRMMSPEDSLLILSAHGMKHFWTRLIWICDLAQYIHSCPQFDWQRLMKRADSLDARGMTQLGLLLAHRLLGTQVPEFILSDIRPAIHAQALELEQRLFIDPGNPRALPRGAEAQLTGGGPLRSLLFHFRTRESWSSALRYCFHRAFTPNVVDQGWLRLPRPLAPLYYVLRPIRLLSKYGPMPFLRSGHRQADGAASERNSSLVADEDCSENSPAGGSSGA